MGTLANISTADAVRAFQKVGWFVDRQRGSHLVMKRLDKPGNLALPIRKEMSVGTLRALIRDAGLTVDEFLAML